MKTEEQNMILYVSHLFLLMAEAQPKKVYFTLLKNILHLDVR